jgi:hypothetical protein
MTKAIANKFEPPTANFFVLQPKHVLSPVICGNLCNSHDKSVESVDLIRMTKEGGASPRRSYSSLTLPRNSKAIGFSLYKLIHRTHTQEVFINFVGKRANIACGTVML